MACTIDVQKENYMAEDIVILRRSQHLRRNMTKEERHLWYDFLKGYPVQFKRQVPFGNYIVDFYCHAAKLAVELDGSQHYDAVLAAMDRVRTANLEAQGIMVLRFSNLDVLRQFENVCAEIDRIAKSRI